MNTSLALEKQFPLALSIGEIMADTRLKEVLVRDVYKECAFPLRPDAKAMSDCCRERALTAVERADGACFWRCAQHEGMVDGTTYGEVKQTYRTREDVHPALVRRYVDDAVSTG